MYHLHRIILFIILIKHWTLNTETQRHIFLIPTLGPQNCSFLLFHYIVFWFVNKHCVKSVRIRSFSNPYFPRFTLINERYSISLRIQSESGKMCTRKTPNTDKSFTQWKIYLAISHLSVPLFLVTEILFMHNPPL